MCVGGSSNGVKAGKQNDGSVVLPGTYYPGKMMPEKQPR